MLVDPDFLYFHELTKLEITFILVSDWFLRKKLVIKIARRIFEEFMGVACVFFLLKASEAFSWDAGEKKLHI